MTRQHQHDPTSPSNRSALLDNSGSAGYGGKVVTESKLALLAARQVNESKRQVLRQGRDFNRGNQEDGRVAPQNDHLMGSGCQVLL